MAQQSSPITVFQRDVKGMAATVLVASGDGEEEVTTGTYRAWKKRNPRLAFVATVGGQEVFVDTYQEMHTLPSGTFAGQLVDKVKLPTRKRGKPGGSCKQLPRAKKFNRLSRLATPLAIPAR